MKKWYFTFGVGDPEHKNCFTVIEAETYVEARETMIERFGLKWAFSYSEEDWMIDPQTDKTWQYKARFYGLDPNRKEPISQEELYHLTRI